MEIKEICMKLDVSLTRIALDVQYSRYGLTRILDDCNMPLVY